MIVKDENNRNYIELTDDKLILNRFCVKRRLKLNKIRAAYMDNSNYIRILYGNRVVTYGEIKIKVEDEGILEEIIEQLNVEKIVFCPDKNISAGSFIVMYLVCGINMVLNPSRNLTFMLIGVAMILVCIITFLYYIYYRRALINYGRVLIYDKKNNIIKIIGMSKKVKEFIPGSETYKLTEHKTVPAICNFKINKYNYVVMHTNILLPKYYREELKELYKVSNN